MLCLDNVSVGYGRIRVLDRVSLEVRTGEIVCVVGPNGAGKTTLLRTISGLLRPDRGAIRVDGRDITTLPPHAVVRLGLVQVPEGRQVFGDLTVEQNLALGAYARAGVGWRNALEADFGRVFDLFPILRDRRKQVGTTLSGGEQQMLAIGRGLMAGPRFLMLDEPTMGLAPLVVETILKAILGIHAQGTTVLLVEQSARLALAVAHRGYVLERGMVAAAGTAVALRADEAVTGAYLGEARPS